LFDNKMRFEADDVEFIESSYGELRRFAAVVAPWDMDPDDVLHSTLMRVLRKRRLGSLDDPLAYHPSFDLRAGPVRGAVRT
jgi:DNA-directed RNA polymerase specialized sigma24 family protein